jgi:tetratricopeptide (TPR) repeat protein
LVKQKGQEITVVGQVFSIIDNSNSNKHKPLYVYFGNPTSSIGNSKIFRIVISGQGLHNLSQLQNISVDELKRLKGAYIKITGTIDEYKARSRRFIQIILEEPAQLELITLREAERLLGKDFNQHSLQVKSPKILKQPSSNAKQVKPPQPLSQPAKGVKVSNHLLSSKKNDDSQHSSQSIDGAIACYNYGIACAKKRNYQKAIQFFNRAIQLNSNNALFYRSRGEVYFKNTEYVKAIKDYKEALRLNPNDTQAQHYLRIVLLQFQN